MSAPYKRNFRNKKYVTGPYDNTNVAVDCSCEIYMFVLHYITDTPNYEIFRTTYHLHPRNAIQKLQENVIVYVYRQLKKYQTYFEQPLDYIFDDHTLITIKQSVRQERYIYQTKCAEELYIAMMNRDHVRIIFSHAMKYIGAQISEISEFIYKYGDLRSIKSDALHDYDCDIYCAKNYNTIISHDLDIFLFNRSTLLNVSHGIRILTVDMLMDLVGIGEYEEYIRYCIYYGTDYNEISVDFFTKSRNV